MVFVAARAYDFTAGCEDTACGSEEFVLAVVEGVLAVTGTDASLGIALVMSWSVRPRAIAVVVWRKFFEVLVKGR